MSNSPKNPVHTNETAKSEKKDAKVPNQPTPEEIAADAVNEIFEGDTEKNASLSERLKGMTSKLKENKKPIVFLAAAAAVATAAILKYRLGVEPEMDEEIESTDAQVETI